MRLLPVAFAATMPPDATNIFAADDPNGFHVLVLALVLFGAVQFIKWLYRRKNESMTNEEIAASSLFTFGRSIAALLIAVGAVLAVASRFGG